jgi:hypothetical protein
LEIGDLFNSNINSLTFSIEKLLTFILRRRGQEEYIVPEAKYQEAEKLWSNGDYNAFLTLAAQIAKEALPNTYPEWQNKSVLMDRQISRKCHRKCNNKAKNLLRY